MTNERPKSEGHAQTSAAPNGNNVPTPSIPQVAAAYKADPVGTLAWTLARVHAGIEVPTQELDLARAVDPLAPLGINGNQPDAVEMSAYLNLRPMLLDMRNRVADPEHPPDTKPDLLLSNEWENDEGNARVVAAMHANKFLHCSAYGWLVNAHTHWKRSGAEVALDRAIVETLIERRAAAVRAEVEKVVTAAKPAAIRIKAAKYNLRSLLPAEVEEFDRDHDRLNVSNGVIDLRTGDLQSHGSDDRFTYCVPVEYDPQADATQWLEFLHSALGDDREGLDYLQEAVGYSLTGHTSEEVLFYLHGPTRSGKGTFTETIIAMMGGRPVADEADFHTFTAKRDGNDQGFDLAGLKACRLVVGSESGKYSVLNAAAIKRLTGGNFIRCAFKHRDFFSYRPQFKVWLASNHPPNVDVDDDAAWYRVRVLEFPTSFAGREDRALKARLRQPDNLAGVLAWAVAGSIAWYGRGARGLQTPQAVTTATGAARERLDYVAQWLEECVQVTGNPDDFVTNPNLYINYENWCRDNGVNAKKAGGLTRALRAKGLDAGAQKKHTGKNRRGCKGIILAES